MNCTRRPIAPTAILIIALALLMTAAIAGCGAPAAPAATAPPPTNTPVPATATPAPTMIMTATDTPAPMPTPTMVMAAADTPAPMPTAVVATAVAATAGATAAMPAMPGTPTPAGGAATTGAAGTVFTLGEGSIARYKVEEVLARTGFKVATGETGAVSGVVVFDAEGNVVAGESRIVVRAATLRTDSDRRDGYVRNRTLETDAYPEVVFRPTSIVWTEPPAGELRGVQDFTIAGDLTVKDETRPVVWNATAEFHEDGRATGQASVEFTFADFGMDKPSVAIVLSVEDTIRLELDFVGQFAAQPGAS